MQIDRVPNKPITASSTLWISNRLCRSEIKNEEALIYTTLVLDIEMGKN